MSAKPQGFSPGVWQRPIANKADFYVFQRQMDMMPVGRGMFMNTLYMIRGTE
jgi:hypothetical protein